MDRHTEPEALTAAIHAAWAAQHDLVEIAEGAEERLTRRLLLKAARLVASRGMGLMLTGPAPRFAELAGYAERLVEVGHLVAARLVVIDGRVGQGDLAGAAALSQLGVAVAWRCLVTGTARRDDLDAFAARFGPGIEWAPSGAAHVGAAAAEIAAARGAGDVVEGLPPCVMQAVDGGATTQDLRGDLASVGVKPPACAGCSAHGVCAGISVETFRAHGDGALQVLTSGPERATGSLRGVPIFDRRHASGHRVAESERLDIAPRYPDTALITLIVPGCDLACIFCETPQGDTGLVPSTPRGVRAALAAMADVTDGVFFTGGEPTLLPWLLDALREARDLGFSRVQMQSHAGRASDPSEAQAWVDAGLTAIDVPLYGPDAATHEHITNTPGSFERTLAGLRNLTALGVDSVVHITLFRSNLPALPEVLTFIDSLKPDAAYIQTTGEVGPPGTYAVVAPSPTEVSQAVRAAIAQAKPQTPLTIADLAPCLLPDLAGSTANWRGAAAVAASPVILPYSDWLAVFSAGTTRAWADVCSTCAVRDRCPGLPSEALDRFGPAGLSPLS